MKRLVFTLFYIGLSLSAFAQKIHFTDTTNVWNELAVYVTGGPPVFQYSSYSFVGKLSIDSVVYEHFNFDANYCSGCGSYIREDTGLNKVYIRQFASGSNPDTDVVLMDYNLHVGDTFNVAYYDTVANQYIVTGMDSTLINTVWHKVWHFSRNVDSFFMDWCDVIEGIGCIQHPTYMLEPAEVAGESGYYMYCFSNQDITPSLSPGISFFNNTTSCSTFPVLLTDNLTKK